MHKFYSHGKLLLTAEYAVLDGAKALALPTKLGQSLEVKTIEQPKIKWKSFDHQNNLWFETNLTVTNFNPSINTETAQRLAQIFRAIFDLNPKAFVSTGLEFSSHLEFPQNWGLGSSSTLINNLAQWANVDAFALLENTFGGSGYDIACATAEGALLYERTNRIHPNVTPVDFNPSFKDQLFFIHLNKKQDSQQAVAGFDSSILTPDKIETVNELTRAFLADSTLDHFQEQVVKHEKFIGAMINTIPIQKRVFDDYPGTIKSLGAWGGDFILACGAADTTAYFATKGYKTCLPYEALIAS